MKAVRYNNISRKRRALVLRIYKKIGLIIASILLGSYIFVLLRLHSSPSANVEATAAANDDDVSVCVRKEIDQCRYYPCKERNGVMEEISLGNPAFGYAGRFVTRDGNITKPIPECKLFVSSFWVKVHVFIASRLIIHMITHIDSTR